VLGVKRRQDSHNKMGDIQTLTQAQIDSFEPTEEERVHARYIIAIRLVTSKLETLDPEIRNKYYCRACRS
jgi:RNase P subunit RPR2